MEPLPPNLGCSERAVEVASHSSCFGAMRTEGEFCLSEPKTQLPPSLFLARIDLKVAAGREGSEGLAWWSCASAGQGHTENGASEDFVRADILRRAWCHCGWGVGDEGAIGLAREYGPDSQ